MRIAFSETAERDGGIPYVLGKLIGAHLAVYRVGHKEPIDAYLRFVADDHALFSYYEAGIERTLAAEYRDIELLVYL